MQYDHILNLGFLKLKYSCRIPLWKIDSKPDFSVKSHSFLRILKAMSLQGGPALNLMMQQSGLSVVSKQYWGVFCLSQRSGQKMLNLQPWMVLGGGLSSLQCRVLYLFHSTVTLFLLMYCGLRVRQRPSSVSQGTQSSNSSSSSSMRLYFWNSMISLVMKSQACVDSLMMSVLSRLWLVGRERFSSSFSLHFSNYSLNILSAVFCLSFLSCSSVVSCLGLTNETGPSRGEMGYQSSTQSSSSSCPFSS